MDQLHALDSLFLDIEDHDVQANIGGLSVHEGPAPDHTVLVGYIESRLPSAPRYLQRLKFMPGRFAHPIWVDDPDFDIDKHLIRVELDGEVTFDRVCDLFGETMSEHLDRSRPLWKIQVVDGLPNDEWALLWTVHHAMVDGVAATELLSLLLSFDPSAELKDTETWEPRDPPATASAMAQSLTAKNGPLKPVHDIGRAARRPGKLPELGKRTASGLLALGKSMIKRNDSPINGPIGPRRRWRTAELDLAAIKEVRKLCGGTVNDVVLAAVTNGMRRLLIARGEDPAGANLRTMVPVSVRTEDEQHKFENHVSAVFVDLPVAIESPTERLREICEQMDRLKRTEGATAGEVFAELAGYIQPLLFSAAERLTWRIADTQRFTNTITTNVPGPQVPLYCVGRKMTALYPYVMLIKDVRITTAIFSYDGGVYFGVTGDYDSVDDLDVLCDGIRASIDELLADAKSAA